MPGISGKFRVGYTAKDTKKGGGGAITGSTHSGTNVTLLIYCGVPLSVTLPPL